MPLVRISLKRGKSSAYRKALADNVYAAMRETFSVPEEDRFVLVHQHDDDEFFFSPTYFDIARGDDLVIVQITANDTRTVDQKKALCARIAERLSADPGVRPQDVFVNLIEVEKENWSFGNGLVQYAEA